MQRPFQAEIGIVDIFPQLKKTAVNLPAWQGQALPESGKRGRIYEIIRGKIRNQKNVMIQVLVQYLQA